MKVKVAIFASGSGSNAWNLIGYFSKNPNVEISALYCDNPNAGILDKMKRTEIPIRLIERNRKSKGLTNWLESLEKDKIDLVLLAGFLSLIPYDMVQKYTDRIINIHPALLPKFGGKGMFGDHIHKAVIENKETETGITIHFVNTEYDKGTILFQSKFSLPSNASLNFVKEQIQTLEQLYYPIVVETFINTQMLNQDN